jgi:hypothetical protein
MLTTLAAPLLRSPPAGLAADAAEADADPVEMASVDEAVLFAAAADAGVAAEVFAEAASAFALA